MGVYKGMKITQKKAEAYLLQDVAKFEKYINNPSYVPFTAQLNQNQFDALVSFAFNLGQGNVKKLCTGRVMNQIPSAMQQYCKAAGKTLPGLQRRRKAEAALYNKKVENCTGATKTEYKAGNWYRVQEAVPVCNGYYGEHGKYIYLSNQIKTSCDNKNGIGYLRKGADIKPVEVRKFDDGSVWFKLDATMACLVAGINGKVYIG